MLHLKRPVHDYIRPKLLMQLRQYGFCHNGCHFLRNSRHGHKHFSFFFEPADRCASHRIVDNRAIFGNHCLALVQRIHRYFSGKHSFYVFKYFFTEYQFRMKVFTESLLGDIIFCRAQSSGHQDNIHPFHRIIYCLHDLFFAVTDGNDA